MIKDNFVESMMFYDKDNIPDDIYLKLRQFIEHEDFQVERVMAVSRAAAGICMWVHAVYQYAHIHRNMQPRLRNLLEHEDKFTLAQAKLGQLRVEANRIKSALESKITIHRAAVKRAKTIEKHMQVYEVLHCNTMMLYRKSEMNVPFLTSYWQVGSTFSGKSINLFY